MDTTTKPPTSATSRPKQPASGSSPLVDRLFQRLAAMYGSKWADLWAGAPLDAIKAEWARALTGVDPEAVRLALDHLLSAGSPFAPTMPEFVSLVRQFARRGPHRLAIVDARRDPPPGGFDSIRNILKRTTT